MAKKQTTKRWWVAPWKFVVKTITAAIMFAVIAVAAVGLNLLIRYLEAKNCDLFIVWGLKTAEYALFIIDLILFGRFLWVTVVRTWREL